MLEAASSLLSATCNLLNNSESTSVEYLDSLAADIFQNVVDKRRKRRRRRRKKKERKKEIIRKEKKFFYMKGRGKKNFFVLLKQLVELVSAHQRQKKD